MEFWRVIEVGLRWFHVKYGAPRQEDKRKATGKLHGCYEGGNLYGLVGQDEPFELPDNIKGVTMKIIINKVDGLAL